MFEKFAIFISNKFSFLRSFHIIGNDFSKSKPSETYFKNNHHSSTSRKLFGYTEFLNIRIKKGVTNAKKLFFELQIQGYQGSYASVNRYVRLKLARSSRNYKPSQHIETPPGSQAQVDWGSFGTIEINGRKERLYCFVFILSYSRMLYIEFTISQNLLAFIQCHIHAFKKLGIPQAIVYDNVKTVVLRREKLLDGKERIHFNPAFLDFAQYFGFRIAPCYPYWPRSKGKVEAGVKYVRNNFIQGFQRKKNFNSLVDFNSKATIWLEEVNSRIHQSTHEKPSDRWAREKQNLSFPNSFPPYIASPFQSRNSTKDGLIQYKMNFYSVPAAYARKKLYLKEVTIDGITGIEIYNEDTIIAKHVLHTGRGEWVISSEQIEDMTLSTLRQNQPFQERKRRITVIPVISDRPISYYDQLDPRRMHGQVKS